MAENNEHRANIDEIMASIKEYTKENINDPKAAKLEIKKFLKTHRPIKLGDYEYGFGRILIIKEENDKKKVREYRKGTKNRWYCTNRNYNAGICRYQHLKFKYGIFFAPIKHSIECKTKDYSFVMEYQNLIKQRKFGEAERLKKRGTTFLNDTSNESSILDESSLSSMDMENDSILDQSAADDTNDNHDSIIITSESLIRASVEIDQEPSSSSAGNKRELDDTEYCMIIVPPVAKKPKLEFHFGETFSFNHPSANTLEKVCEKLNIKYRHDAYIFWGKIFYRRIPSVSENIKTHSFKTPNIFACFSQFFTGKTEGCFDILKNVNEAFREDLISAGIKSNADIEEICTNITVSDEHLEFIAKFLSCRIGIYENKNLKKYGNWETENSCALTLILSFENGFYSVVLDL